MSLLFRMTAREGPVGVAVGACSLQDQLVIPVSKRLASSFTMQVRQSILC